MHGKRRQQLEALRRALQRRGWVVRDGAQFGADALLYTSSSRNWCCGKGSSSGCCSRQRGGPHKQHKQHAPFVLLLLDSSITWRGVCGLSRLAASVGKELLLAVALLPPPTATAAATAAATAEAESCAAAAEDSLSFRVLRLRPLQQLVRKRAYRERGQVAHKAHKHQFLEKKKDWQQRARRYKQQQQLLQRLAEKARTRNPQEFSCKQLRAQQEGGGSQGLSSKNAGLVRLARADAAAAAAARSPAAAAAAEAEVLRLSSRVSLVSTRSEERLRETRKQLLAAKERAAATAAALLQLKQQTLLQQVKKHAAVLGAGFGKACSHKPRSHVLFQSDTEGDSDSDKEKPQQQQQQREEKDASLWDQSESDSECRWLQMARKKRHTPRAAAAAAAAAAAESSDSDGPETAKESYERMQSSLMHAQRLRRLQQQLQQHRDEQKKGRRRQVTVRDSVSGKETRCTQWFLERKK
ncbi:hypothetical protein Esti_003144 [Eimeria stiedai]